MAPVFLSKVELYYSNNPIVNNSVEITGDEAHHIKNVMRHQVDDEIYITDGSGSIFQTKIISIEAKKIAAVIIRSYNYPNPFVNITFCIPRLRTADRFEFALEKCVELGITNFIVFDSKNTVAKGEKLERWQKILVSAMKQSLRSWLPKISYMKNVHNMMILDGEKIFFEQSALQSFQNYLSANHQQITTNRYLIFGPEGGFSEEESKVMSAECRVLRLTDNRLRSETAIITAAALLVNSLNN